MKSSYRLDQFSDRPTENQPGYGAALRRSQVRAPAMDRRFFVVTLYTLLFFLYAVVYKYYLSPNWSYTGFIQEFNFEKFVFSAVAVFAFAYIAPLKFSVRSFYMNFLITFYLLPSLILFSFTNKPFYSVFVIIISVLVVNFVSSISVEKFSISAIPAKYIIWIFAIATAVLLLVLYFLAGLRNFNLDISRVYEFRRDAADDLPGVFSYLISIFSNVFIPFGVILSLKYRYYIFTIFFFFMSIVLFGFTSHKSILFAPFVIFIVYEFLSRFKKYSFILISLILLLCAGVGSEIYAQAYGGGSVLDSFNTLLIRRAIMVPPLLDYFYLDFFGYSPHYYWSNSFISFGLSTDNYGIPAPKVIGDIFFSSSDMSANTGFIGSGYAQAGIVGAILYAIGVGLMFAIFEAYGRYLGQSFVAAALFGQMVTMIRASDFLTMFLTHGVLISLIVMVFVRTPESDQFERARRTSGRPVPVS